MKEKILKLRDEGKSYNEIVAILGCSISNVGYYCSPGGRERRLALNYKNRKSRMNRLKIMFGSKCSICGYNKCLSSLHFHHIGNDKIANVAELSSHWGRMLEEARKCELVCANCHGEIHERARNTV